ncbi:MAG: hypothetical protein AAFQ43_11925 [Bacteroidota bacterium]
MTTYLCLAATPGAVRVVECDPPNRFLDGARRSGSKRPLAPSPEASSSSGRPRRPGVDDLLQGGRPAERDVQPGLWR